MVVIDSIPTSVIPHKVHEYGPYPEGAKTAFDKIDT